MLYINLGIAIRKFMQTYSGNNIIDHAIKCLNLVFKISAKSDHNKNKTTG